MPGECLLMSAGDDMDIDSSRNGDDEGDNDSVYLRVKLYIPGSPPLTYSLHHPPRTDDPVPDRITFIAHVTSAMTIHQGLFGSATTIDIVHCLGMECWIRVHKE